MRKLRYTATNLRYLLWRTKKINRAQWAAHLASWADCDKARAAALLRGSTLRDKEQRLIAKNAGATEEEIQTEGFWKEKAVEDHVNILRENLAFLTDKRLGKKLVDIEKETGISRISLHRWKSGKHEPKDSDKLLRLVLYFGLDPLADLKADPIFLEMEPIGGLMRKQWLQKKIDKLENQTLNELYPALQRLLRD
jgi:hypothetical protein